MRKVFGSTSFQLVRTGLRDLGVSDPIIAAWLREDMGTEATFMVNTTCKSRPIRRHRSVPQGVPSAPFKFEAALDVPAAEFRRMCAERKWGINLGCAIKPNYLNIILFADNFWLYAETP